MKRFAVWVFAVAGARRGVLRVLAQDWIALQDGKTLAGWKAAERPESWVVEDGVFVSRGERSHLFYVGKVGKHDFRNFEFSADVMTSPGANSGIYVHTKWQGPGWPEAGYELQVINSNPPAEKMNGYIEHKMTGSIYAVRNTWQAPVADNEWFNYRIRVVGKTIQTFINDKLICEYAEARECIPSRGQERAVVRLGHVRAAGARSGQRGEVPQHEGAHPAERCRAARGSRAARRPRARSAHHAGVERQHSADRSRPVGARWRMPAFWSAAHRHGHADTVSLPLRIQDPAANARARSPCWSIGDKRAGRRAARRARRQRASRWRSVPAALTSFDEAQLKRAPAGHQGRGTRLERLLGARQALSTLRDPDDLQRRIRRDRRAQPRIVRSSSLVSCAGIGFAKK